LKYERESFAVAGGEASGIFWVKVTSISAVADTDIYVYYRSTDTADGADPTNAWNSDYLLVWHLGDGSTLSANDSTANNYDGTVESATATSGMVDGAANFSGSAQAISVLPALNGLSCASLTLESWVYLSGVTSLQMLYRGANDNFEVFFQSGVLYAYIKVYQGEPLWAYSHTNITTGWHHVTVTWTSGEAPKIYVDGINGSTADQSRTGNISSGDTSSGWIGGQSGGVYYLTGKVDEFRMSAKGSSATCNRSAEWIKFEYYNMNSVAGELTFGAEEVPATGGISVFRDSWLPSVFSRGRATTLRHR
jgi:hypothetical protein